MTKIRVAPTGDDKLDLRRFMEDQGNVEDLDISGILSFLVGGGFRLGAITVKDNATATVLNSAAKVQFVHFDTNGPSRGDLTPDHTSNDLTIPKTGIYVVICFIAIANDAAQSHIADLSVWKNNGTTEIESVHSHRNLTGGSGDIGSVGFGSLVSLDENDTLELWANTDSASDRSVTISDCSLFAVQLAGA